MQTRLLHVSLSCLALLSFTAVGLELSFDSAAAKNRPVSKVITLLKDMLKQLEKEAAEDEAAYDRLACWCSANDKEKTQAVQDAEAKIADLNAKIAELRASGSRLSAEIDGLGKEVEANEASKDSAGAIRGKQQASFRMEEHDLIASITALKAAIVVLSKHHSGSLVQMPRSHVMAVAATLQHELQTHASLLQGVLTPSERRIAAEFVQKTQETGTLPNAQSYAPQSGEIYGILQQMLENFQRALAQAESEEDGNQKAYGDLSSAKGAEINAGANQEDVKRQELASVNEKRAEAEEDLDDTKRSLGADQEFLLMLKEKCSMTDKEWEERQRQRQLEMEAISKAIALLSSDDAHDLFTRTFNPAFLQEAQRKVKHQSQRDRAAKLLTAVGQKFGNPTMVTLAYRIRLDAFTKVKQAIEDMIAQLLKEKEDEAKHKDFCQDEFGKNQMETEKTERKKEDLTAKIEDLSTTIQQLGADITSLKGQVAEMQVQVKRAGEDREKQNAEFQSTVTDQAETQKLLKAAYNVLAEYYGKAKAALLRQEPPPEGLPVYKKQEGHSSVMSLLTQIISDAKAMEDEARKSELDAQKAYQAFVKETDRSIQAKGQEIVNKAESKAQAEQDLVTSREAKSAAMLELEQLSNYNAELHQSCDFILKNFEVRQTARDEEVEALRQAKAILSGANFDAFLQA